MAFAHVYLLHKLNSPLSRAAILTFIFFCLCFVFLLVCLFVSKASFASSSSLLSTLLGIPLLYLSKSIEVTLHRLCIVLVLHFLDIFYDAEKRKQNKNKKYLRFRQQRELSTITLSFSEFLLQKFSLKIPLRKTSCLLFNITKK